MNREDVVNKLLDHEARIQKLEYGSFKIIIYLSIAMIGANALVAILMKVLLK